MSETAICKIKSKGILCHYTIMPILGFTLATVFSFPKEIAADIILVGCCPSGLASNVMSFLARANLALSVSVTSVSTLLAPFLTPMLMRFLGREFIEIQFWRMVWDIVKIVILPILAGLIFHYFVRGRFSVIDKAMPIVSMAGIALIIVVITGNRQRKSSPGWFEINPRHFYSERNWLYVGVLVSPLI
jgi:bile acid:Na+ symporter, BASS family